MKFKAPITRTPKNTYINVFCIPVSLNDCGINSKNEIRNIMPDEKPMPMTIPLTLFLKCRASHTPINVVEPDMKANKKTAM